MTELLDVTVEMMDAAAAGSGWERAGTRRAPTGETIVVWRNADGAQFATPDETEFASPLREAVRASAITFMTGRCPVCAAPARVVANEPLDSHGRVQLISAQRVTPTEILVDGEGEASFVAIDHEATLAVFHGLLCGVRPASLIALLSEDD